MTALARRVWEIDRYAVWGAGLAVGAALLYRFDPRGVPFLHCPFHALTGLDCPGCGTLRAAHSLLHGDISAALGWNLLMVLSMPLLVVMVCERRSSQPPWRYLAQWDITRRLSPLLPWIVIGYGITRNLPFWPFTLLSASSPP